MFSSQNSQVSSDANYIEDVFQTWLYTGNGSTQTITNGIDLSTKGGLVWVKARTNAFADHALSDTANGVGKYISSNSTAAQVTTGNNLSSFNVDGFTVGSRTEFNQNSTTYASWTFRKQPKFFDVVTYTGNGTAGRTVAHSLGSVPGCMIVRPTSAVDDWFVYHRSLLNSQSLFLNLTTAASNTPSAWNSTTPTSTEFTVGTNTATNANGVSYVAYLFAHNAGGFGLTGTDNVISCGSFTTDGSGNATVSLGYEPQWVLIKSSSNADGWQMVDTMRGMAVSNGLYNGDQVLQSQASSAETSGAFVQPSATGFDITYYGSSRTYIYIAIRRGPMKVPTSGTSVFAAQNNRNGPGSATAPSFVSNFPIDMFMRGYKPGSSASFQWLDDRLRDAYLVTSATDAEASTGGWKFDCQTGVYFQSLASSTSEVGWMFRRAPSFFDEVCYTGTGGTGQYITHNLGVSPELIISKRRDSTGDWHVYHPILPSLNKLAFILNSTSTGTGTGSGATTTVWQPTATTFWADYNSLDLNNNGAKFVSYLFASCSGVSKVGNYTGNGSTQTINCGFTGGARFVMIKAVSTTGDWMVADSARGIVSGSDPYLELNNTNAEVTGEDWLDTDSTGFVVNQVSASNANTNGVTYIYLAIA